MMNPNGSGYPSCIYSNDNNHLGYRLPCGVHKTKLNWTTENVPFSPKCTRRSRSYLAALKSYLKSTQSKPKQVCIPVGCVPSTCGRIGWGAAQVGSAGGVCIQGRGLGRHPPVNRMTHRYKNITLSQTSFAGSKKGHAFTVTLM